MNRAVKFKSQTLKSTSLLYRLENHCGSNKVAIEYNCLRVGLSAVNWSDS